MCEGSWLPVFYISSGEESHKTLLGLGDTFPAQDQKRLRKWIAPRELRSPQPSQSRVAQEREIQRVFPVLLEGYRLAEAFELGEQAHEGAETISFCDGYPYS